VAIGARFLYARLERWNVDSQRKLGPYARDLLFKFIAVEAIPPGGGLAAGNKFFTDADHRHQVIVRGMTNFELAIAAMRAAPDNPYGDDEEAIAAAILARIEQARQ
jgi:hypothetical protein